jgi:hypothetical protein
MGVRVGLLVGGIVASSVSAPALATGISDSRSFVLPFVPDSLSYSRVQEYDRITIPGEAEFAMPGLVGKPSLPVFRVRILIPADAEITQATLTPFGPPTVVSGSFLPLPIQPDTLADSDDVIVDGDPAVYESETPYPPTRVWVESVTYMRGVQYATVSVTPCEWVGASRELRVYPLSTLQIAWTPDPGRLEDVGVRIRERAGRQWTRTGGELSWLQAKTLNFSALEGSSVEYVIITDTTEIAGRSVGDMVTEFQRLADWKTARGVPAVVRTVTWINATYAGADLAEKIRNFLVEAYTLWGTDWVLLGGDVSVVPTRRTNRASFGPGDPAADAYFGCLDGTWDKPDQDLPSR